MATTPLLTLTLFSRQFYSPAPGSTDPSDLVTVSLATNEGSVIKLGEEASPRDGVATGLWADTITQIVNIFNSSDPAVQLYYSSNILCLHMFPPMFLGQLAIPQECLEYEVRNALCIDTVYWITHRSYKNSI